MMNLFIKPGLVAQETDCLDRIERKLKKPVSAAADMEELSEDLGVCYHLCSYDDIKDLHMIVL